MNGSLRERAPLSFGFEGGPPPRDVLILIAIVFATFSVDALSPGTMQLLRLTPAVWEAGFVWQVFTFPWIGYGSPDSGIWFLLELLILFWFGRDVYRYLGRRGFWRLLALGCLTAGVLAVGLDWLLAQGQFESLRAGFPLIQGQRILLTILIAAFATLYGHATILLFFVLPIQAKWFLGIEILFAFMAFLGSLRLYGGRDLAGFLAICVTVGVVFVSLRGGNWRRALRELRLRFEQKILEVRLKRMRSKKGFRVVQGGHDDGRGVDGERRGRGRGNGKSDQGPWVH